MVAIVEKTAIACEWIAIIYNPSKEHKEENDFLDELSTARKQFRIPLGRFLQVPLPIPKDWKPGTSLETKSIFLRPGANLSLKNQELILLSDWQAILKADEEKGKRSEIQSVSIAIKKGVYETLIPDLWDGIGSPGYRHFSPELAKKLIFATTHEDWLDEWIAQETRAEIIKASGEQKERIIAAKKRSAA